jgi:hypothetical protein
MDKYGTLAEQDPSPEELAAAAATAAAQTAKPVNPAARPQRTAAATPRTLYVSRKVLYAGEIIAWAKGQGVKAMLTSMSPSRSAGHRSIGCRWEAPGMTRSGSLPAALG